MSNTANLTNLKINYLTQAQYDEALGNNEINDNEIYMTPGDSLGVSILNIFYPVGSYYETSDISFDPNAAWTGTWILETEGQVHVSSGTNYTVGDTGGEATHTLTVDEMPSHSHSMTMSGGMAPQGTYNGVWLRASSTSTTSVGGGEPHNNMPPYIVVNRWHRIA